MVVPPQPDTTPALYLRLHLRSLPLPRSQPSADVESRPYVAARIASAADQHAPSRVWHLDTLLSVLAAAGPGEGGAKPSVAYTALWLLTATEVPSLPAAVTHKLFVVLLDATAPSGPVATTAAAAASPEVAQTLLQTAVWAVGEYGRLLLDALPPRSGGLEQISGPLGMARDAATIVSTLRRVLALYYVAPETRAWVLTALVKLSAWLPSGGPAESARTALASYGT